MNALFGGFLFDHYLIVFSLFFFTILIFGISVRWGLMLIGLLASMACIAMIKGLIDDQRLQRDGVPAIAQIVSTVQTPIMVGNSPVLEFKFEIRRKDGSSPYVLTTRRIVPLTALATMQPGYILPVRILPDSETLISFDQPLFD